jgi:hypothetical protein
MTEIEDASISEFDGFIQQLLVREHSPGHEVPYGPQALEILERRHRIGSVY